MKWYRKVWFLVANKPLKPYSPEKLRLWVKIWACCNFIFTGQNPILENTGSEVTFGCISIALCSKINSVPCIFSEKSKKTWCTILRPKKDKSQGSENITSPQGKISGKLVVKWKCKNILRLNPGPIFNTHNHQNIPHSPSIPEGPRVKPSKPQGIRKQITHPPMLATNTSTNTAWN